MLPQIGQSKCILRDIEDFLPYTFPAQVLYIDVLHKECIDVSSEYTRVHKMRDSQGGAYNDHSDLHPAELPCRNVDSKINDYIPL